MTHRSLFRRVATAAPLLALAASPMASASTSTSTTLGDSGTPASIACTADQFTAVQAIAPTSSPFSYTAGTPGVITRWWFAAGPDAVQVKLKALRLVGASSYQVVGASAVETAPAGTVSTWETRIPMQAGDQLGLTPKSAGACLTAFDGGIVRFGPGDLAVGQSAPFVDGPAVVPISVKLEADADGDGFGDQTQDACPRDPTPGATCDVTPPQTKVTKGPQQGPRTTARFVFRSDDPTATFKCRLKLNVPGAPKVEYRSCRSPITIKHLKVGRYKFSAFAIDPFGNRDRTPAYWKFTVTKH